jgi:hypothetical protein
VLVDLLAPHGDALEVDLGVRRELAQPPFEVAVDLDARRVVVAEVGEVRRLPDPFDGLRRVVDLRKAREARVTIKGTPHSSVTRNSTPASASFSSQTSTYSSSSRQ